MVFSIKFANSKAKIRKMAIKSNEHCKKMGKKYCKTVFNPSHKYRAVCDLSDAFIVNVCLRIGHKQA